MKGIEGRIEKLELRARLAGDDRMARLDRLIACGDLWQEGAAWHAQGRYARIAELLTLAGARRARAQ